MVEYYALMYKSEKMRAVETVLRTGEEGKKENDGGENSTMIYCRNSDKCHNVPPLQ
jgi:hypothetical protein